MRNLLVKRAAELGDKGKPQCEKVSAMEQATALSLQ